MQDVLKFLTDNRVFFLATTEGDRPRVRPLGFVMEYEGKIMFQTSNNKDMCKQMKANPKVEMCATSPDGNTLRICGKVAFNSTIEAKRKALDVMPALSKIYSIDDKTFEIFYLKNTVATFQNMQGEKKTVNL